MADRDLVIRLRAENDELKAKLAESTAQVEEFKAANAGVAPGAAAATAALDAEGAAAKGAAAGLGATAAEAGSAASAQGGLATAAQGAVGGLEAEAGASRAAGAALGEQAAAATAAGAAQGQIAAGAAAATAALESEAAASQAAAAGLGATATEASSAAAAQSGLTRTADGAATSEAALGTAAQGAAAGLGAAASQAGSAASAQAALATALDGAERAFAELATASVAGGAEMQAAAARALAAYKELDIVLQTTASTAVVSPAQLAQVEALNAKLAQLPATEAAIAASTRTATTAITQQGVEAAKVETILVFKARIAQEASAREAAAVLELVAATRAANGAIVALGESTVVGGKVMTAALLEARNAVAALEVAQAKLRVAGGLVPPGNLALLASYDAQVKALTLSTGAATVATTGAATSTRLFTAATAQAGQALAGKVVNLGSLTAGFMRFLGPVGLAIAAITILPGVIKAAREKLDELTGGVGDLEKGMEGFDKTMRKFGVSMKEGFTFKEATTGIDIFMREYAGKLKIGENATRNFVEGNKTSISQWMQAYEDAKQQIPTALLAIADKYDILTPKQQELIDKFKASKKPVDDLAASVANLGKEMSADFTFDFASGKQIADIRTGLQGVAADARDVAAALREIKPAADIAFPVYSGGSSQLGPSVGVPALSD